MTEELAPSGNPGGVSQTDSTAGAASAFCADSRNDAPVHDAQEGGMPVTGVGSDVPARYDERVGADGGPEQPGEPSLHGGQWPRAQRDPEPPKLSLIVTDFDAMFDTIEEQWQERALCAQTDPEAFFPEKGGSTREAKRICMGCEVRDECLEYALAHDERFGIWGGLSERERRRLKRGIS
jgi:WhiB family transcriptional regulator, redox-sensing transcriptional regulator